MQPCAVCGGVTVNTTGHCTQCGTFRGNSAEAPGGYGGYPAPAGPGYQQPMSGPGYGQPVSAAPGSYPASGPPAYPASGPPAYPASGAPGYPGSGPPAYPPTSGGGYPTSYPPVQPAGGGSSGKGKPFVVPLVALSITLVVVVVAIVVVVVVRGGDPDRPVAGSTTPPPTGRAANSDVDPCVVGRWRIDSHREDVPWEDIGQVTFTGGEGAIVDLSAGGKGKTTYSGTTYQGEASGQDIKLQLDGAVEYDFTARDGTVSFKNLRPNGTAKGFVNGEEVASNPMSGSDDPAKYTCYGSTMTQSTDLYETTLTKVR